MLFFIYLTCIPWEENGSCAQLLVLHIFSGKVLFTIKRKWSIGSFSPEIVVFLLRQIWSVVVFYIWYWDNLLHVFYYCQLFDILYILICFHHRIEYTYKQIHPSSTLWCYNVMSDSADISELCLLALALTFCTCRLKISVISDRATK